VDFSIVSRFFIFQIFATFIFNAKQSVAAIDLAVTIQQELASIAGSAEVGSLGEAENVKKILVRGMEAAAELCLPIKMMVPMAWRPGQGSGGLNVEAFLAQAQDMVAQNEPPMHRTLEDLRRHGVPLMQEIIASVFSKQHKAPPPATVDPKSISAAVASSSQRNYMKSDNNCWNCGKTAAQAAAAGLAMGARDALLRCSRCKRAVYCSAGCQKVHWKSGGHKAMCEPAAQQGS